MRAANVSITIKNALRGEGDLLLDSLPRRVCEGVVSTAVGGDV